MGELVVAHHLQVVWLVEGRGVPLTPVYGSHAPVVHLLEQGSGPGVGNPSVELAERFPDHEFHSVGLARRLDQGLCEIRIHDQGRARLVVKIIVHPLQVRLQGEVYLASVHGPVRSSRGLPSLLRPDVPVREFPAVHRRDRSGVGNHMDILVHGVHSALQGEVRGETVLARKPQFRHGVELGRIKGKVG